MRLFGYLIKGRETKTCAEEQEREKDRERERWESESAGDVESDWNKSLLISPSLMAEQITVGQRSRLWLFPR